MTWLRYHSLRRWLAKMERDGPVPPLLIGDATHKAGLRDLARSRHDKSIADLRFRLDAMRERLIAEAGA